MKTLSGKLMVPVLLALAVTLTLPVCARQVAPEHSDHRGRTTPPVKLACERNQLTSWNGQVSAYKREKKATSIEIKTDWGTVEALTLEHGDAEDLASFFMLSGQPFTKTDWPKIESAPGVLVEGMRAIVWLCLDGETPAVIDWRPGSVSKSGD